MITDARVFEAEFVPRDVVHRDSEINYLSSVLQPLINSEPAEPVFLYGPSGTGKTCIAQYTVEQLSEEMVDLDTQYVNCWEDHSRYNTLYRILQGVDKASGVHRQSTPTAALLERLKDYDEAPYVVILDEVDQLDDKNLLYELLRIQNIELVFIANEERELFANLGERLRSRLQTCVSIQFDKYNDDQLTAILKDRVRWGLQSGVIDEEQLRMIADAAAGDARVAIGILRRAARDASQSSAETITDDVIQGAVSEAKSEIRQKDAEKLNQDQRVLYGIINEHGEITPSALYDAYSERVTDPKSKRMVRNYLQKMVHYNLIIAEGETKGRRYRSTE